MLGIFNNNNMLSEIQIRYTAIVLKISISICILGGVMA